MSWNQHLNACLFEKSFFRDSAVKNPLLQKTIFNQFLIKFSIYFLVWFFYLDNERSCFAKFIKFIRVLNATHAGYESPSIKNKSRDHTLNYRRNWIMTFTLKISYQFHVISTSYNPDGWIVSVLSNSWYCLNLLLKDSFESQTACPFDKMLLFESLCQIISIGYSYQRIKLRMLWSSLNFYWL